MLVARSLSGDAEAYASLVKSFGGPVFSLLMRLTANLADSEDLSQEVFVRAYKNLHKYDPEYPFLNWILTIAHNEAMDLLKARGRAPLSLDEGDNPPELPEPGSDAAELSEKNISDELVRKAVEQLPPLLREALLLRHKDGLSYQDIAQITGLPINTVRTHIRRGRLALREKLSETFHPA